MDKLKKIIPTKSEVLDLGSSIIVAILLCVFLFIFIVVPSEVEGASMAPNFATGDRLYTSRLSYWLGGTDFGKSIGLDYVRGDVIVVDPPSEGKSLIKRIIGMPGDRIMIKEGKVYLNGTEIFEPYLSKGMTTEDNGSFVEEGREFEVKCSPTIADPNESCYFALGDNRRISRDSREIGLVRRSWIQGRVVLRIWPLDKISPITASSAEIIKVER